MKLIWLDLETTGLDPETDSILEIAAFEATLERPFDVTKLYESVLEYHGDRRLNPLVQDMHTVNRLFEACAESIVSVKSAEIDLLHRISADRDQPVLAGSSVHFDHSFIKRHMPTLNTFLSHRHYDVSAIKLFAQSLGMAKFPKVGAHRAAEDVLESIAHAKAVVEWLHGMVGRPPTIETLSSFR